MPLVVLVRDEAGDSAVGEKYESPPRWPGDCAPLVCTLRDPGGAGRGKRGGGARAIPASECWLSMVPDRWRILFTDPLAENVAGAVAGP